MKAETVTERGRSGREGKLQEAILMEQIENSWKIRGICYQNIGPLNAA